MSRARYVLPGGKRAERICVIWRDPHPATTNVMILIAYLHHRGILDPLANEDGDLMMNRFQLSEMTRLPPSIILSDDPEDLRTSARPIYDFFETSGREDDKRTQTLCALKIECESELFQTTKRDIADCAPLKRALGKGLMRFTR